MSSPIPPLLTTPSPVPSLTHSISLQLILNLICTDFRVNGYPSDNASTYGIATALISSSLSLGGVMGPTVSGAMVDLFGFPWTTTIISALSLAGVC